MLRDGTVVKGGAVREYLNTREAESRVRRYKSGTRPEQKRYRSGTEAGQKRYKTGTKAVQKRYKSGTKRVDRVVVIG